MHLQKINSNATRMLLTSINQYMYTIINVATSVTVYNWVKYIFMPCEQEYLHYGWCNEF